MIYLMMSLIRYGMADMVAGLGKKWLPLGYGHWVTAGRVETVMTRERR